MPYNIIVVEDDKAHREDLTQTLQQDYGHCVVAFADLAALEAADRDQRITWEHADWRLAVILDVMLARRLPPDAVRAERWTSHEAPKPEDQERVVDDTLGLLTGQRIREGDFTAIPRDTPLLFFTARGNPAVKQCVAEMGRATLLSKPAFTRKVNAELASLLR
jgi:DNA-binding response OmpR family regulator